MGRQAVRDGVITVLRVVLYKPSRWVRHSAATTSVRARSSPSRAAFWSARADRRADPGRVRSAARCSDSRSACASTGSRISPTPARLAGWRSRTTSTPQLPHSNPRRPLVPSWRKAVPARHVRRRAGRNSCSRLRGACAPMGCRPSRTRRAHHRRLAAATPSAATAGISHWEPRKNDSRPHTDERQRPAGRTSTDPIPCGTRDRQAAAREGLSSRSRGNF